MSVSALRANIISAISRRADASVAAQQRQYFKNVIQFRGLKAPALDTVYKSIVQTELKNVSTPDCVEVALELLKSQFAEEKRFGVSLLKRVSKHISDEKHLQRIGVLFDQHVYYWGTCDSLCGQVLHEFIVNDKALAIPISAWRDDGNLWKKRASCVAFVKLARHGNFNELLLKTAKVCVRSPERFVQLGCGWMLRELSLADLDAVVDFIKTNHSHFSREGLRYAIEKMQPKLKKTLTSYVTAETNLPDVGDEVQPNEQPKKRTKK